MEGQLEELQHRFWHYLSERHETLLAEFDQQAQCCVYRRDRSTATDPQLDFVFSDKTALHAVRFKYFMADCRQLAGDDQTLKAIEDQERNALLAYLEREYQAIIANFDAKIIKLRKKRKIRIAEEAADDFF